MAKIDALHGAFEVVDGPVLPRECLRLAMPHAADVPLSLLGGLRPGLLGVHAGQRGRPVEVLARRRIFLDCAAARRQVELPGLDRDDAAEHVDRGNAVGAVVAVLADDAEGPGAEPRRGLVVPALAGEANVVRAPDAGLALAPLRDVPQRLFLWIEDGLYISSRGTVILGGLMGIAWSNEDDAEDDNVRKALEALDLVVWESDNEITMEGVVKVLAAHSIFSRDSVKRVKTALRDKAAEQHRKCMFFINKGVTEFYNFHRVKRDRYNKAHDEI